MEQIISQKTYLNLRQLQLYIESECKGSNIEYSINNQHNQSTHSVKQFVKEVSKAYNLPESQGGFDGYIELKIGDFEYTIYKNINLIERTKQSYNINIFKKYKGIYLIGVYYGKKLKFYNNFIELLNSIKSGMILKGDIQKLPIKIIDCLGNEYELNTKISEYDLCLKIQIIKSKKKLPVKEKTEILKSIKAKIVINILKE